MFCLWKFCCIAEANQKVTYTTELVLCWLYGRTYHLRIERAAFTDAWIPGHLTNLVTFHKPESEAAVSTNADDSCLAVAEGKNIALQEYCVSPSESWVLVFGSCNGYIHCLLNKYRIPSQCIPLFPTRSQLGAYENIIVQRDLNSEKCGSIVLKELQRAEHTCPNAY